MAGKIILDEIEKSSTGTGIKLNSPLLSNTGVQIISESGTLGSTITFPSTIDNTTLGSGVTFPAGHIIQTVQHVFTGTASISSVSTNSFASFNIPFSKGITPFLSSSKILVSVNISLGHDAGSIHTAIYRDGTKLTGAAGDVAGNRFGSTTLSRYMNPAYGFGCNSMSFNYLDSPTIPTTPIEIVYEIKATLGASYNDGIYLNHSAYDSTNADYTPRTASFMTLFEIAQ